MECHALRDADPVLMDELARLVGHERRRLELLLFKLVEERHLLAAGEARFLPYAAAEVERAMERLQEAELRRSMLVHRLAAELELPEEALTMSALARDSLEPYRTIFSDHRKAFLEVAAEIEDVTCQNRRLAERGAHDVDQLEDADIAESVMELQLAQTGYQAVLGATARLTMPSLVDWLK
jgi:FlgN protein